MALFEFSDYAVPTAKVTGAYHQAHVVNNEPSYDERMALVPWWNPSGRFLVEYDLMVFYGWGPTGLTRNLVAILAGRTR